MKIERWKELLDQIKTNFKVEDQGVIKDEEQGGTTIEYIVFAGPMGVMRLEFSTHPLLLETKTRYHKRIGSETEVDYIYSPTEKVSKLEVFRWDEATEDWLIFKNQTFFN